MGCSVKIVLYRKDEALLVPATAVFEDDSADPPSSYVYLAGLEKDGKHAKRPVKIGKSSGGKTEIVQGLAQGDEILTAKP